MTISLWYPFSRSYGVILPSSLTMLLPSALGFSPHPPVSVYGTGCYNAIAAFLDTRSTLFSTINFDPHHLFANHRDLPLCMLLGLHVQFHFTLEFSSCVPTFLTVTGAGILTSCPSTTPFGLALGPDLPREDKLDPGNLGYSAFKILT